MKWSAKLGEFAGDSCLHPCHILNRNCVGSLCALAGEAQRRGRVDRDSIRPFNLCLRGPSRVRACSDGKAVRH